MSPEDHDVTQLLREGFAAALGERVSAEEWEHRAQVLGRHDEVQRDAPPRLALEARLVVIHGADERGPGRPHRVREEHDAALARLDLQSFEEGVELAGAERLEDALAVRLGHERVGAEGVVEVLGVGVGFAAGQEDEAEEGHSEQAQAPALEGVKIIAVVSPDIDLQDRVNTIWGVFTRFDAARDITFTESKLVGPVVRYGGRLGIDATWKTGYPEPLDMPDEIKEKVNTRWADYGI